MKLTAQCSSVVARFLKPMMYQRCTASHSSQAMKPDVRKLRICAIAENREIVAILPLSKYSNGSVNPGSATRAAITEPKLRREIGIDLDALVNTINLGSVEDLSGLEHVRRSILNHGFPDMTRLSIDEHRVDVIREDLAAVLMSYEPRLIRKSIAVERDETLDRAELKVRFLVRADLNCDPLNVPVQFVADLELDTGKIAIKGR